jgi:hypothetical protein
LRRSIGLRKDLRQLRSRHGTVDVLEPSQKESEQVNILFHRCGEFACIACMQPLAGREWGIDLTGLFWTKRFERN